MKLVLFISGFFLSLSAGAMTATYRLQTNPQIVDRCDSNGKAIESLLKMDLPAETGSPLEVTFRLQLCTVGYGTQQADLTLALPRGVFEVPSLLEMTPGQSRTANGVAWTREASSANGLAWYSLRFAQPPVSGLVTLEAVSFAVAAGKPRNFRGRDFAPGATVWSAVSVRLRHRLVREPFLLRGTRTTSAHWHKS